MEENKNLMVPETKIKSVSINQNQSDYEQFMEAFHKDYSEQIALTASQLKNIVNEKNVNGKGEKLAQAVQVILEKRLDKAIERNKNMLPKSVEVIESVAEEIPMIETKVVGEAFLKYGVMDELWEQYGESEDSLVTEFLESLEYYTDVMELCMVDEIECARTRVCEKATKVAMNKNIADLPFIDFAEKVKEDFLECKDVLELAKWCVEHNKLRQAAELLVAKLPEYFFAKKYLYYENYHETKQNDGSYADAVIDARKQARSKDSLYYFWLNEMLWKNASKKLYLNVDKAVLPQDGNNARRFKLLFREVRDLQETKKNKVQVEELSKDLQEMFEMIAEKGYISPVLNTTKKVCNYFFNYEATGTPGSVQKNYRDLSLILLSNRNFCEQYFGEESVQIANFTPASIALNKDQPDVKTCLLMERLEKILRAYENIKEQVELMGKGTKNVKRGNGKSLQMDLEKLMGLIKE